MIVRSTLSSEILDTYDDLRIVRYKGEKNVGLSNVLNVGTEMARDKYIARMDSDDISLPNRLQVQVKFLGIHSEIDFLRKGRNFSKQTYSVYFR